MCDEKKMALCCSVVVVSVWFIFCVSVLLNENKLYSLILFYGDVNNHTN